MKKSKRILALCLAFGLLFTACSKPAEKKTEQTESKEETRIFKDDLGREVTLKQNITRVAPSGNPAQVMLHIYEPNKLVGVASKFSKGTEKYISDQLKNLPEFGAFYGKKANLNMEAVINAKPDVIIDMGEKKKGIEEDLNKLQEQLKIPVVFIELTLEKLPEAFDRLAEVLGNKERGKELSEYIKKTYKEIEENKAKIKDVKKVYVSGHSKGGNKSQYIGVLRGNMSKLERIYSFDGQGFNSIFLKKYNKEIENNRHKIFNICNEYDYVNILLFSIANKIFIKSTTNIGNDDDRQSKLKHRFGGFHSPYSMFKNENGILKLNDVTEQSDIMKNFEKLFEYYNTNMEIEDSKFMYYRMSLFMMESGSEVFGEDIPTTPKGFLKRFTKLTKEYTKHELSLIHI